MAARQSLGATLTISVKENFTEVQWFSPLFEKHPQSPRSEIRWHVSCYRKMTEKWMRVESLELTEILGDESCCSFCWSAELLKSVNNFRNKVSKVVPLAYISWDFGVRHSVDVNTWICLKIMLLPLQGVLQQAAEIIYWTNSKTLK